MEKSRFSAIMNCGFVQRCTATMLSPLGGVKIIFEGHSILLMAVILPGYEDFGNLR